ncbi:MAG: cytochrome P450 [Gammaproteobacteria bacterium]|nr:MAG: cytochrome P450 [Gammaproteobacteria bacterium]
MSEPKTCPFDGVLEVDFNSEPFLTQFKDVYTQIHASGCPYAHSTAGDHYAVASHPEIMSILKQYDIWKSKFGPGLAFQPEGSGVLVSVDPPDHTFEVKIVASSFSMAYFESLIPTMQQFVDETIDSFYKDGQVDLHSALSVSLPLFVIFTMLGIPLHDEQGDKTEWIRDGIFTTVGAMLKPGEQAMQEMMSGDIDPKHLQAVMRTQQMFVDHLADCKNKLESGEYQEATNIVCRFLTTPGPDGTFLSDEKILGFCAFLLTAGSATTTIMLSNIIYRLLTEPEEFAKLQADPALIPMAIEETLRLDAPVQGLFRTNDEDVDLGPIHVAKDTKVMLLWAAGNLDPTVFDDPLSFSLDRDMSKVRRHLAFGYGTHFCRGAPLARLEGEIFLRTVLKRLPNLRLAGEITAEKRMPVLQGIGELPVAWDVASRKPRRI